MAKVYVTNYNSSFDYSAAEAFGELIFMSQGVVPSHYHAQKLAAFRDFAAQSSSEDYLLLSGSNILCSLASIAWSEVHENVNILSHATIRRDGETKTVYTQTHVAGIA